MTGGDQQKDRGLVGVVAQGGAQQGVLHVDRVEVGGSGFEDHWVGERGPLAEEFYAAGTPLMHGSAAKRPIAARVAQVRIGDELRVERRADEWVAMDDEGAVGTMRWQAVYDGKPPLAG